MTVTATRVGTLPGLAQVSGRAWVAVPTDTGSGLAAPPGGSGTTQLAVTARAVAGRAKLQVVVSTQCRAQFHFQVQRQVLTTAHQGSDEPAALVSWRTLGASYTTRGTGHGRTINLPAGTYRAVVGATCGYSAVVTDPVRLRK